MSFSKTDKTQIAAAPAAARTEHEQTNLQRLIDRLVYDLYGLTEEEIRIVMTHNKPCLFRYSSPGT
jgi:hypothetical protein